MAFAQVLRHLRKLAGESQEDIAQLIGKTAAAISKYDVGRSEPSFEEAVKIAEHFKIHVSFLICSTALKDFSEKLKSIIGETTLDEFIVDVKDKHGMEFKKSELDGTAIPENYVLKVLAKYAGININDFFDMGLPASLQNPELLKLNPFLDDKRLPGLINMIVKIIQNNLDMDFIKSFIDNMVKMNKGKKDD